MMIMWIPNKKFGFQMVNGLRGHKINLNNEQNCLKFIPHSNPKVFDNQAAIDHFNTEQVWHSDRYSDLHCTQESGWISDKKPYVFTVVWITSWTDKKLPIVYCLLVILLASIFWPVHFEKLPRRLKWFKDSTLRGVITDWITRSGCCKWNCILITLRRYIVVFFWNQFHK